MPFEDLLYAANNYQLTGYQAILNNVAKSYGDNQKETLKQHLRNAKWYAESESKNERDKLNYLMLKNTVSFYDKEYNLDNKVKNQIFNYLMSRSEVLFAMSNSFNW